MYEGHSKKGLLQPTRISDRKGLVVIKKLADVSKEQAKKILARQALQKIYLPAPKYVSRPKFDVSSLNTIHPAYILFYHYTKLNVDVNTKLRLKRCRRGLPLQRIPAFDLEKALIS